MATADFDLTINIDCNHEEAIKIINVLKEYSEGTKGVYFSYMEIDGEDIDDIDDYEGSMEVTALGPYGSYMFLDDVDIFRDLAMAAPNARFDGEINGCTSYTEQSIECSLKDGILDVNTYFLSNDDVPEAYIEYFKSHISYNDFINALFIDKDAFDISCYDDLINEVFCYFEGNSFDELEYDDFSDFIEIELDEDLFNEFISNLDIDTYYDFEDKYECGCSEHYQYDPVNKQYIKDEEE